MNSSRSLTEGRWYGATSSTSLIRSYLLLYLRTQLDTQMTLGFLEHLVSLPYAFFQQRSEGDLMMRVNSNLQIRELSNGRICFQVLDSILNLGTMLALSALASGFLSPISTLVSAALRCRSVMGRSPLQGCRISQSKLRPAKK
jgi:ABC-type bacteriocin/lantibiotic exporter with double-glycine peptidase domain